MPGVPSGRGCDGCRGQKKKCDQAKPSCSRCARLNMPCIGAGKQRFKFKQELVTGSSKSSKSPTPRCLPNPPTNPLTILTNGFINTVKASTDMRFNLAWSYGNFLQYIPSRLGTNEALDSAVEAVIDAHSTACCLRKPTPSNLVAYSKALRKIKTCLDDPTKATSSETLAAVMILLICQNILGVSNRHYTGHGEGAARILKVRGRYYDPQDSFESILLLSLRGPVVFEGCFNPRIQGMFTGDEWKRLVENHLDASYPEGRMMRCIAKAPDFIRRGKAVLSGLTLDLTLLDEMRENYERLKAVLAEFVERLKILDEKRVPGISYLDPREQFFTVHQRLYGITLVIGIILNLALASLDILNLPTLQAEGEDFVRGILSIWKNIAQYKPIGSTSLQLFLTAAWAGTSNLALRIEIEGIVEELEKGFVLGSLPRSTTSDLVELENHLKLLKVNVYDPSKN